MIKKNFKKFIFLLILLNCFLFLPFVYANENENSTSKTLWDNQKSNLEAGGIADAFGENGDPQDPQETIALLITVFLTFLGIIAVSLLLWSGFIWMTSQGNQDKINDAKKWAIRAVIGLTIIIISGVIVNYVLFVIDNGYSNRNPDLTYPYWGDQGVE